MFCKNEEVLKSVHKLLFGFPKALETYEFAVCVYVFEYTSMHPQLGLNLQSVA